MRYTLVLILSIIAIYLNGQAAYYTFSQNNESCIFYKILADNTDQILPVDTVHFPSSCTMVKNYSYVLYSGNVGMDGPLKLTVRVSSFDESDSKKTNRYFCIVSRSEALQTIAFRLVGMDLQIYESAWPNKILSTIPLTDSNLSDLGKLVNQKVTMLNRD